MSQMRFHWSMSSAGEKYRGAKARAAVGVPELDTLVRFCRHAEDCDIESVLTAFGFHRPDPIVLAAAVGVLTTRIKFMVAVRSGVFSPAAFVQQVNTVSTLTNGRICLNVVAGHTPEEQRYYGDFLAHDERYDRTDEFLTVCNAFWRRDAQVDFEGKYYRVEKGKLNVPFVAPDRTTPEIFLGGGSGRAEQLALKHADCLWRLPDTPDNLRQRTPELIAGGIEVGLLVSLIVRPTRHEAIAATEMLLEEVGGRPRRTHEEFAKRSDSVAFTSTYALAAKNDSQWLTDYLWAGAVPFLGAPAMAIVGSPEDVADALFEFRAAGITQFLFMGWPDMEEMTIFHDEELPLVRAREAAEERQASANP
jgi:alkanesulfonate monooxygenase